MSTTPLDHLNTPELTGSHTCWQPTIFATQPAIETSLQVHEELHAQVQETQRLRAQQVERARYTAELAQRRFLRVTS